MILPPFGERDKYAKKTTYSKIFLSTSTHVGKKTYCMVAEVHVHEVPYQNYEIRGPWNRERGQFGHIL